MATNNFKAIQQFAGHYDVHIFESEAQFKAWMRLNRPTNMKPYGATAKGRKRFVEDHRNDLDPILNALRLDIELGLA